MTSAGIKIFSTKYALTDGIREHTAERCGSNMVCIIQEGSYPIYLHGEGKDWHTTMESAVARAEELRIKKLQSLDRQIKKLSALRFE